MSKPVSIKPPSSTSGEQAAPAPTYDLLGVGMSVLTIPDAVRRILAAVEAGQKGYVCVTGMHGIMEARDDPKLQRILNSAFLCTPDGMPTVWLGKAQGHKMERVYGPDLMLAVMEATHHLPVRHFFYGGAEGVALELKERMEEKFPGIRIAGTFCPPFRPLDDAEKEELRSLVGQSGADIVWVGLSTPKQERFMAEFLPILPVKVMLGVGAAFDFHTGRAKQAPRWMMRAGLEWFFRLVTEPRRLWKRYMIQVPRFASLVALDRFALVSHSSDCPEMPGAFAWGGKIRKGIFFSVSVLLLSALLCLNRATVGDALVILGFQFLSFLSLIASAVMLLAGVEEERVDRIGPIYFLATWLYQSVVVGAGGVLICSALVFWSPAAARTIASTVFFLSCVPLLLPVLLAIALRILPFQKHLPDAPPRSQP